MAKWTENDSNKAKAQIWDTVKVIFGMLLIVLASTIVLFISAIIIRGDPSLIGFVIALLLIMWPVCGAIWEIVKDLVEGIWNSKKE